MNWKLFFAKRSTVIAGFWILLVLSAAILAPILIGPQSFEPDSRFYFSPPRFEHPLGTDLLGRDLLMRLTLGASSTLGVGVAASFIAILLGAWIGASAGWFGGFVDRTIVFLIDVFLCFPVYFFILAVIAVLGPNPIHVTLILGFTGWMGTARLVRSEVLSLSERPFILSARAMGASNRRIIVCHLLPNAFSPVLVSMILRISGSILTETSLSFLGLGIQPPMPSWGNILADAKPAVGIGWWLMLFPGAAIFLTVFSLNLLGERLSEILRGSAQREFTAR